VAKTGGAAGCAHRAAYARRVFAEGKGVPQDYIQSHIWFSLAASKLPPGTARRVALQLRQGVSRKMSGEQIDEAKNQAQGLRSYEKGLGK